VILIYLLFLKFFGLRYARVGTQER